MIKTTFVTLAKAAERLGSDETELLIACIEDRIRIYGLVQGDICHTVPHNPIDMFSRPARRGE